jgi:hypothetical protein
MLRVVGLRHLHNDVLRDETSNLRVVFITPKWEDTCTSPAPRSATAAAAACR